MTSHKTSEGVRLTAYDKLQVSRYPHPFVCAELYWFYNNSPSFQTVQSQWFTYSIKNTLELSLMDLSNSIRHKERWREKIKDHTILSRWKDEAAAQHGMSREAIAYVVDELNHMSEYDVKYERSTVDGCWHSDVLVDEKLREDFMKQVELMEKSEIVDWHPETNSMIRDIVHPSMYPLIAGVSKIIPSNNDTTPHVPIRNVEDFFHTMNHGVVCTSENLQNDSDTSSDPIYRSSKFQWLPSDVYVDPNGTVKFTSYINNVHPEKYSGMYAQLEEIIALFIPLFERVLTDLLNPLRRPTSMEWTEGDYKKVDDSDLNEEDDDYDEVMNERLKETRKLYESVEPFTAYVKEPEVNLKDRKLQVIVKIASTEMTSDENPKFDGGSWHVEGCDNERIVATGIYYYDVSDNITESRLKFRQAINEPMDYSQNDDEGVAKVFGIADNEQLHQDIGYISTRNNRCIAFPNVYQHCVAPFELKDRGNNRKGHRKVLVFFLVDPKQEVISTATVPPQRRDWFGDVLKARRKGTLWDGVNDDVWGKIIGELGSNMLPMSVDTANEYREELMKERKYIISKNNEELFERGFSLCEH